MPKGRPKHERPCRRCGRSFLPSGSRADWCSLRCRVWDKIMTFDADGCWPWEGTHNADGYGLVTIDACTELVPRVVWTLENGPIPEGKHVLHSCDNPSCCRLDHLFLGTHQDNMADRDAKGRQASNSGEDNSNAVLTEKQVREIKTLKGSMSQGEIAEMYGVSRGQIGHIHRGVSWGHV